MEKIKLYKTPLYLEGFGVSTLNLENGEEEKFMKELEQKEFVEIEKIKFECETGEREFYIWKFDGTTYIAENFQELIWFAEERGKLEQNEIEEFEQNNDYDVYIFQKNDCEVESPDRICEILFPKKETKIY